MVSVLAAATSHLANLEEDSTLDSLEMGILRLVRVPALDHRRANLAEEPLAEGVQIR